MHITLLATRWRKWLVGNLLLLALCASGYGQLTGVVFYVDGGGPSGTTQPGVNGSDLSNMRTLALMVNQLNAGQPIGGSGSPFYTWTLKEVTSFAAINDYQTNNHVDHAYVVSHSLEVHNNNGSITYLQTEPGVAASIYVAQANGPDLRTADAAAAANVSEDDMYYCGKYGDDKAINADDVGAAVAGKTSQTYPQNVTQTGALNPTKSGGRANTGGGGGATTAPQTPQTTSMNGYWQSINVYWETWTTYPNGGGVLAGHYSTSWAFVAIPGSGGGGAPGNTVQN